MKSVSVVMTIVGFIAGPAYYVYCNSYSGKAVGTYRTSDRLGIVLDPQMNPVSIGISLNNPAGGSSREYYVALLQLGNRQVAARSFSASDDSDVVSVTMDGVDIQSPGEYDFRIENVQRRGVAVLGIQVEVRRNTKTANMKIMWSGVILLILGLLLNAQVGKDRPDYER